MSALRSAGGRLALLALVCGALIMLLAAPAAAHGRATDASNYRTEITDAPDIEGVRWSTHGGDELLGVANEGPHTLVVLGYEQEPYLRLDEEGVWRNWRSPAAYLNEDRYGESPVPAEADADADPEWELVSSTPSFAWHDHRIHWMSPADPEAVVGADAPVRVLSWEVPFTVDGERSTVAGELWWEPGPSPLPWLAAGLVLVLPALAGLRSQPAPAGDDPEGARWPGLARPAAVVVGVLAVLNITRLIDDLAAVPLPLGDIAFPAAQTLIFVIVGVYAAWRGWQAAYGDIVALAVGATLLAIGQGVLLLPALGSSQLTTLLPDWLSRLILGATLAQALPVIAVAVIAHRRLAPTVPEAGDEAHAESGPDEPEAPG